MSNFSAQSLFELHAISYAISLLIHFINYIFWFWFTYLDYFLKFVWLNFFNVS